MSAMEKYREWCEKVQDAEILKQLADMKDDPTAIENSFYKELEFGTGGLRGELGAGTNCLNVLTIGKVTQGIANRMKAHGQKKVAVSCDTRIRSDLFKETVACVMAANGIHAVITCEPMPTPFLSFLTREEKADFGIMITASHNPAEYNGYKVYDGNGCQLTDEPAKDLTGYIEKVDPFSVHAQSLAAYIQSGMVEYVQEEITKKYLACVLEQSIGSAKGLKVAYSPLNGTGYKLVPEILHLAGAAQICVVEEQAYPDGNFTTCPYPNPEKPDALKLGIALAEKCGSDILIATDPDADRVGTAVRHNGEYRLLTGNEVGVLLTDYILSRRKAEGTLPMHPVIATTIVSTGLAARVAAEYGATFYSVLTGFKYIGGVIGKLEKAGEEDRFVLGFEESYGYLAGSYVRDKDAVLGSMLVAEMTAYHLSQGKTLVDRINEIYAKYGTYEHKLKSYKYSGAEGNAKMKKLLSDMRANLPTALCGSRITKTVDYLTQSEVDLPKADVLSFEAENGSKLVVRPSGTEPLIKVYLTAASTPEENKIILQKMTEYTDATFG